MYFAQYALFFLLGSRGTLMNPLCLQSPSFTKLKNQKNLGYIFHT